VCPLASVALRVEAPAGRREQWVAKKNKKEIQKNYEKKPKRNTKKYKENLK
jgi:hypothetical protein